MPYSITAPEISGECAPAAAAIRFVRATAGGLWGDNRPTSQSDHPTTNSGRPAKGS